MSEAYENDLAEEQAIFDTLKAIEPPIAELTIAPTGGRPSKVAPLKLVAWRQAHGATIKETASRFKVSEATVSRLCKQYGEAAKHERKRWECERLDSELRQHSHELWQMFNRSHARAMGMARLSGLCEAEADLKFREDWARCVGPIPDYMSPF